MYSLLRPLFFKLDAEKAHYTAISGLQTLLKIGGKGIVSNSVNSDKRLEREVFGIKFKNPVGLAAGFDKNAKWIEELDKLGFGFIEIGTLTPKPQDGNPKPRLFRLKEDNALINRMGFNNEGVEIAVERLKEIKAKKPHIIVGGNIGKNKVTPNEEATSDYIICFDALFDYVDYFVVNVSSPNTPNLRELQEKKPLTELLQTLQNRNQKKENPKPLLLKIAPDLTDSQLDDIIEIAKEVKLAGIIATNTTISRENLKTETQKIETISNGGLSGKPLTHRSTEVISYLHRKSDGAFPIIGVGGIHSPKDAIEKLEAGASLIQLYTGFVYEGWKLIGDINQEILKRN
ncbi:quinone-dependent dihydroorotate dehydrogenase [Bernardetia sp.]|uniref:quinone-dependent dihydroorotate dehydrogenase n=1 Tax=Bernardetia sp. TaxID=1937974 RepID=UPI0025C66793|nr:quinone-dependent dihydroorotate dehydrogenase [Bernardetia sp.]